MRGNITCRLSGEVFYALAGDVGSSSSTIFRCSGVAIRKAGACSADEYKFQAVWEGANENE
jgi:hypothetical protein